MKQNSLVQRLFIPLSLGLNSLAQKGKEQNKKTSLQDIVINFVKNFFPFIVLNACTSLYYMNMWHPILWNKFISMLGPSLALKS